MALWIKEKNEETGEHGPQVPVGVQPLYSVAPVHGCFRVHVEQKQKV